MMVLKSHIWRNWRIFPHLWRGNHGALESAPLFACLRERTNIPEWKAATQKYAVMPQ
jgi:hypothetical protein